MSEVKCHHCNGIFTMTTALLRWREARGMPPRYCSKACHSAHMNGGITDCVCAQCGRSFTRPRRNIRKAQRKGTVNIFCSRRCSAASGLRRTLIGYRHIAKRPLPDINLSPAQAGYIAGIIDGEGSFSLYPARNGASMNVSLAISNTDMRILNRCREMVGVGALITQKRRKDKDGHKRREQFIWAINARNDLRALLPHIIPLLVGKAEQARVVLSYCEDRAACKPIDVPSLTGVVPSLNRRSA